MKKVLIIATLILGLLGPLAKAADLSFIPSDTEPRKEFVSQLQSGNAAKAIRAWPAAFGGSAFASTMDGRALHAYTIAQAGLPLAGIKTLIRETQVGQLNKSVLDLWQPILNDYVTELPPGLEMNASWKRLFSSHNVAIKKSAQIPGLMAQANGRSDDDLDKTRLLWKIATTAPQFNDTAAALKALQMLSSCNKI